MNRNNTYLLRLQEKHAKITLSCKCPVFTPNWQIHEMKTWKTTNYNYPVKCVDNDHECNPKDITYISPANKSNGLYVFLNRTFTITETTALMCISDVQKEFKVLFVSLQGL